MSFVTLACVFKLSGKVLTDGEAAGRKFRSGADPWMISAEFPPEDKQQHEEPLRNPQGNAAAEGVKSSGPACEDTGAELGSVAGRCLAALFFHVDGCKQKGRVFQL